MSSIRKALIALAAGIGVAITALADGTITTPEALTIVLAVLGALGVYAVPNTPALPATSGNGPTQFDPPQNAAQDPDFAP